MRSEASSTSAPERLSLMATLCVSVGEEVTISGMRVCTGNLLHGDVNSVVHIPDECASLVAEAAFRIWTEEGETLRRIASPEFVSFSDSEVKH